MSVLLFNANYEFFLNTLCQKKAHAIDFILTAASVAFVCQLVKYAQA